MASTRRRQSLSIIERLTTQTWKFAFIQAVRVLEAAVTSKQAHNQNFADNPIAGLSPPQKELVHFNNHISMAFSTSNVTAIKSNELNHTEAKQQWQMTLQFMGLTGSQGVMPYYFTEILLRRLRDNDEVLATFINIFEHRSISLFYQSSRKYQLPLQYEHNRLQHQKQTDLYTHSFASLAGLGTSRLTDRLAIPEEAIYGCSGLYSRPVRSAAALKGMLKHYFDLDAEIQQFCGIWENLPTDILTRLTGGVVSQSYNNMLGMNSILGERCWQVQSQFRIKLATMNYASFMQLIPGGKKLKALQGFIDFFTRSELDYEIVITLDWKDAKPTRLIKVIGEEPLLGWNTPLGDIPDDEKTKAIDIVVSKHTISPDAGLATVT